MTSSEAWGKVKTGEWTISQYYAWCDKELSAWTKQRDQKK